MSKPARTSIAPLVVLVVCSLLLLLAGPVRALEAVVVEPDTERIELTPLGEAHEGRGDTLQIVTAPGNDGATDRMSVKARTPGTNPNWFVFALRNNTDKPMERWLVAERYNAVGSGVVRPDLDARRIEALTPSVGFVPDPMKNDRADILHLTLEPGQTITYVAEMATGRFTRMYLWKPVEFEQKARDRQLFNGIMLGIVGLLAVFVTAIFAANHKLIFPVAATVVWCVLAYLCVEFGFWHKLFQMRAENNAQYRAAGEASVAASLVIFLFVFLRIVRWRGIFRLVFGFWITAQLVLVALALVDPRLAATFARASFVAIAGVGALFIAVLAIRGQDRALALVPTWLFLGVWTFAAGMMLTGRLSGELVVSSLVAGLVLIAVLIGFTVTQFAFRSLDPYLGATPDQQQLRALAVDGAGAAVWEWNSRRDEVKTSANVETALGLVPGELSCKTEDFVGHLHSADRERLRIALGSLAERRGGELEVDFRMRHADNSYRWFEVTASSVPTGDVRTVRCVGLMRDITDAKRAQERLLQDAVHDSLTGLPLRELLLDRLSIALRHAVKEPGSRPSVVFIDVDRFKSVNSSFGTNVGDSVLLTVARRLARHLDPRDTLARISGDRFAVLVLSETEPVRLTALAEGLRWTLRVPIKIAGQEIVLSGSFGLAMSEPGGAGEVGPSSAAELVRDAEIAMYRARREGVDRVEVLAPTMRDDPDGQLALEEDLRKAIERKQLTVLYQPVVFLPTEELAGFEALVRWEHPRLGALNPGEFVPIAEQSDLIVRLGSFVLGRAVIEVQRWQKELPREDRPIFVAVNVSSRQLIGQELLQELRLLVSKAGLVPGSLKLEITESLVMDNPEQASRTFGLMRECGVDLALDDFGTGYSSLAYLQRFPFDTIKIDKTLVQSAGRDTAGAGATIVRSIVALGHELGKKIVAEGVEEQEDVSFLRSLDCEYAQGYWYGEPMPAAEALGLLRQIRKQERRLRRRSFFTTKRKPKVEDTARSVPGSAPATASAPQPNGFDEATPRRPVEPERAPMPPAATAVDPRLATAPPPPGNGRAAAPYAGPGRGEPASVRAGPTDTDSVFPPPAALPVASAAMAPPAFPPPPVAAHGRIRPRAASFPPPTATSSPSTSPPWPVQVEPVPSTSENAPVPLPTMSASAGDAPLPLDASPSQWSPPTGAGERPASQPPMPTPDGYRSPLIAYAMVETNRPGDVRAEAPTSDASDGHLESAPRQHPPQPQPQPQLTTTTTTTTSTPPLQALLPGEAEFGPPDDKAAAPNRTAAPPPPLEPPPPPPALSRPSPPIRDRAALRAARAQNAEQRSTSPAPPRTADRPTTLSPQLAATLARIAGLKGGAGSTNRPDGTGGAVGERSNGQAVGVDAAAEGAASRADAGRVSHGSAKQSGGGRS